MSLVDHRWEASDVAVVTLARPGKRNALSPELLGHLTDALADLARSSRARALLLVGQGPVFCAGGDIDAMQERLGRPKATEDTLRSGLNRAIQALWDLPVPTVAAVQGAAVGAGLGLALSCDVVVAANDARLGATHARLGLTPDGATSFLLPRLVGPRRALAMVQGAELVTGEVAADWGLVTEATEPDRAQARALERATELARGPTRALARARHLLYAGLDGTIQQALEREARSQGLMYATRDQREGVQAFLEKREPSFEGR